MNSVLEEILATGMVLLPSGESIAVSSQIGPRHGSLLQAVIAEVRPKIAVEIGLAFGVSTLYMLDALAASNGHKLIGIDPSQFASWQGGGLHNVERAGYTGMYEFHGSTSQNILPKLVERGERVSLAFIDGWHTFDHALVDFFYVDQMLEVGGIVVFDDVGYPALRRLCEFVISNRSYEIHSAVLSGNPPTLRQTTKLYVRQLLSPLYRTDRTPSPEVRELSSRLQNVEFIALRKTADDERRWNHFVHF